MSVRSSFAALCASAVVGVGAAGAAAVVDQTSMPASGQISPGQPMAGFNVGGTNNTAVSQSFTAGLSGALTRIDLALYRLTTSTQPITIKLYGSGVVPLATATLAWNDVPFITDFQTTDFANVSSVTFGASAPVVQAGAQLRVTAEAGTVFGLAWLYQYRNGVALTYAAGEASRIVGGGAPQPTGADVGFRTWVDAAAVPEPRVWALMIAGFALVGAGLRRRGLASAA